MADDVDPRLEAEAQIARALQIVIDADDRPEGNPELSCRDYTADELETLFFALGTAMVQLAKLPGGAEARHRFYERAEDVLVQRGRQDILDDLKVEHRRRAEARRSVRQAFGESIDLSPGTSGSAIVRFVELEMADREALRVKIEALAESFKLDTNADLDQLLPPK